MNSSHEIKAEPEEFAVDHEGFPQAKKMKKEEDDDFQQFENGTVLEVVLEEKHMIKAEPEEFAVDSEGHAEVKQGEDEEGDVQQNEDGAAFDAVMKVEKKEEDAEQYEDGAVVDAAVVLVEKEENEDGAVCDVVEAEKEDEDVKRCEGGATVDVVLEETPALSAGIFYAKRRETVIVPAHPAISDDEEEEDDDVADPDFLPHTHNLDFPGPSGMAPSAKRKCLQPAVEELRDGDSEDGDDEDEQPAPHAKRPTKPSKSAARPTTWHKGDLDNPALPEYQHSPPDYTETPFQYFMRYFSPQLIQHITYQTNLYAAQKDVNTTFTTTEDEIMSFLSILIYMGIAELPSVEDYWAMETRVPQIANLMSSKRFRLLKRVVHFNDNTSVPGTSDRFFKVRPLFCFLNAAFRREPQTPKQSVDEVMVAYQGKTAGNLRQYVKSKPDKWGFKLFARASEDGFIHDMVLYQGRTTLEAHGVPLTTQQQALSATSQIVSVLASTMSSSSTTAIFADSFFSSLELVRYLRGQNCRYTGTARDSRIRAPPLRAIKEMENKAVPRGSCDYVTSEDGILVVRWKDNKTVTLLSTDMGVEPMSSVIRYRSDSKRTESVACPAVIRSYNANMGGVDKSDMLVHLYRTPMKSRRWYMRLFAYALDVSLTNAWIMYRRDCRALGETGLSLKNFRIRVFRGASSQRPATPSTRRSSSSVNSLSTFAEAPTPVRGHRSHAPNEAVRFDASLFHAPVHASRQTCKLCSRKGNVIRSNIVCRVCRVHLCLKPDSNCFIRYHEEVA